MIFLIRYTYNMYIYNYIRIYRYIHNITYTFILYRYVRVRVRINANTFSHPYTDSIYTLYYTVYEYTATLPCYLVSYKSFSSRWIMYDFVQFCVYRTVLVRVATRRK